MRESLGGSMLLYLVVIFAGLVIVFFVGILSYSKAYRVKNRIIELIEKYETYDSTVTLEVNSNLKNVGYDSSNPTRCTSIRNQLVDSSDGKYKTEYLSSNLNKYGYNYCIYEVCDEKDSDGKCIDPNGKYYVVVAFIRFEFPIIGDVLIFPVYGETKILGKSYNY